MQKNNLDHLKVHVQIKLAGLWASVMFCYIYADYFGLYQPGTLRSMLDGKMGPLGETTQAVLVGTSLMMLLPSVMIFLALVLPPAINRWANIVLGLVYTALIAVTLPGAWAYYVMYGVIEMALTLAIVVDAWRWPQQATQ